MKNRGSTPILTNAVGVHPRNIHTKFEANPCSGLRGEVEKLKSSRRQQRQRRQRQRRRRRRTQPDRYSHTHSLSVTKKVENYLTVDFQIHYTCETLDTLQSKHFQHSKEICPKMELDNSLIFFTKSSLKNYSNTILISKVRFLRWKYYSLIYTKN